MLKCSENGNMSLFWSILCHHKLNIELVDMGTRQRLADTTQELDLTVPSYHKALEGPIEKW